MDTASVNIINNLASGTPTKRLGHSPLLTDLMRELAPLIPDISTWINSNGGGNTMVDHKNQGKYILTTTYGDLGKLVHELTHIRCHRAFNAEFGCYHVDGSILTSMATVDPQLKLGKLMTATADQPEPKKNKTVRAKLITLCNSSGLSDTQKNTFNEKIRYGEGLPFVDHDTVINQVYIWLFEWGYPKKDPPWYSRTKPTKKLFKAVEDELQSLIQQRAAG